MWRIIPCIQMGPLNLEAAVLCRTQQHQACQLSIRCLQKSRMSLSSG